MSSRLYRLYGLRLRSVLPLPAPPEGSGPVDADIVRGSGARFARVRAALDPLDAAAWFQHRPLADGAHYLRWSGLFEFLVERGGRRIVCRALAGAAPRAFETYLLGQVLSFALVERGMEPLHSTAVVVGGVAVGFVGDCGDGKSTLGAAFLRAGDPLLTDDLLVLGRSGGGFVAHPGPPRIKLMPDTARAVLRGLAGTPMNDAGPKLVIPLPATGGWAWRGPAPLARIYVLRPPDGRAPRGRAVIRRLAPRRAFVELTRNTFNACVVGPRRLARQFDLAARVSATVPVMSLAVPRGLGRLAAARDAILADLAGGADRVA